MTEKPVTTLRWIGDENGFLVLLDQTRLPSEVVEIECRNVDAVVEAIRSLRVRGAPAIGVAAAYGLVLGAQSAIEQSPDDFFDQLENAKTKLAASRPTAVNLFWALERMVRSASTLHKQNVEPDSILSALLEEARTIEAEDRAMCEAIGRHGAELLTDGMGVLTHCNAGALATAGEGTALSLIYAATAAGKKLSVFVDETRPLLQGARLTAWELRRRDIQTTLICDSMAARVMQEGRVQAVVVGADRIAANGDVANKIGTYGVALAAAAHDIPFYVAAPTSTFDLSLASGAEIPIEQRAAEEVAVIGSIRAAPEGVDIYNPAFDITPARLVTAIICERGVIQPVSSEQIENKLAK